MSKTSDVLERLIAQKRHGAWCIDNDCDDEDHIYWYVPLDAVEEELERIRNEEV